MLQGRIVSAQHATIRNHHCTGKSEVYLMDCECIEIITRQVNKMYQLNYDDPIHVHFTGIGGISMSGLAELLLFHGFTVSGSDNTASDLTEGLIKKGCRVFIGQKAENIDENIDLLVYTAAVKPDNPELLEAKRLNIPILTRADLLGQIMKNYSFSCAVSGTHGKTTTTSILSSIALSADLDPTISVGGILDLINGNIRIGNSEYFITEACEYTNSFLSMFPKIGIILNIEADHLDFFKDLDDIRNSFRRFAALVPKDGAIIINADIKDYDQICKDLPAKVVTFSDDPSKGAAFTCKNIRFDELNRASYTLVREGKEITDINLKIPGKHNIENSLAAIAAAYEYGISPEAIKKGISCFKGTDRRFEYKGEFNGVTVIDDYGHHPTEIRASLNVALNRKHNTLWCAFQPHTYSRTKALFNDFIEVLKLPDRVILADIYAAREKDTLGMSSELICNTLNEACPGKEQKAFYFDSFEKIADFLKRNCKEGDVVITMGAGNIYEVGDILLGKA